jgi:ABC-type uncharacterized transport system involved in gliding motility auxiliary subunit
MNDTSQPIPQPAASPPPPDDDAAMFYISLASGFLGTLAIAFAIIMYLAEKAGPVGTGIAVFGARQWILAGGVGLFVLGVGLQAGRIWDFINARRSVVALNVLLMSVLAVALSGILGYLGSKHVKSFDWTRQGLYSISDTSVQVAKNLARPVKIYVLWTAELGDPEVIRRLLDHYKGNSDKLEYEFVDPALEGDKFKRVVKDLDLEGSNSMDEILGIVVQSGGYTGSTWKAEKSKHLSPHDLFESSMDPMSGGRGPQKFKGESAITNALIEVTEGQKPKIYFLTGHGEADLEGQNTRMPSNEIGFLSRALRTKNYDVQALDIMKRTTRDVPEDASCVVAAGPTLPFDPAELAALDRYLASGGKLLALVPPIPRDNADKSHTLWVGTGLEPLLRRYNVEVENEMLVGVFMVIDENGDRSTQSTAQLQVDGFDGESKITKPFTAGGRALFVETRPLKALKDNPHAKAAEILKAPLGYFPITELRVAPQPPKREDRQQNAIMVAVEQKIEGKQLEDASKPGEKIPERATRIVVAGDANWITNPYLDQGVNEPLILNCFSYLLGQERFSREPVREGDYKLDVGPELARAYSLVACPGLPFLAILLGVTVWLIRRR